MGRRKDEMTDAHIGFPFSPFSFFPLHTSYLLSERASLREIDRQLCTAELVATAATANPTDESALIRDPSSDINPPAC